jgi:hypothetical protein
MFAGGAYGEDQPPRYLAFQFFTAFGSAYNSFHDVQPPEVRAKISELKDRIGVTGTDNRRLGFILGPQRAKSDGFPGIEIPPDLCFPSGDDPDEQFLLAGLREFHNAFGNFASDQSGAHPDGV